MLEAMYVFIGYLTVGVIFAFCDRDNIKSAVRDVLCQDGIFASVWLSAWYAFVSVVFLIMCWPYVIYKLISRRL